MCGRELSEPGRDGTSADWLPARPCGRTTALIYCAIIRLRQDGPWADRPAYDQIVGRRRFRRDGRSRASCRGGDARRLPAIGYESAGLTAAMAIMAPRLAAETACGLIDVSMLASDAGRRWAGSYRDYSHRRRPYRQRAATKTITSRPSRGFQAAPMGWLNIAANKDEQMAWRLALILKRETCFCAPEFATREDRKTNSFVCGRNWKPVLTTRPRHGLGKRKATPSASTGRRRAGPTGGAGASQVTDRGQWRISINVPGIGALGSMWCRTVSRSMVTPLRSRIPHPGSVRTMRRYSALSA